MECIGFKLFRLKLVCCEDVRLWDCALLQSIPGDWGWDEGLTDEKEFNGDGTIEGNNPNPELAV